MAGGSATRGAESATALSARLSPLKHLADVLVEEAALFPTGY
jgi:hypothetical protein